MQDSPNDLNSGSLPLVDGQGSQVPVFDCQVILSPPDSSGNLTGRVAALPEVTATGANERDVLIRIVSDFKARLRKHLAADEPIPWLAEPQTPGPGEQQRWIPVHL